MSASSSSIRSERIGFGSDLASSAHRFPLKLTLHRSSGDGDEHVIADHILGDQRLEIIKKTDLVLTPKSRPSQSFSR